MELSDWCKAQEIFESSRAVAQHEFPINSSDRALSAAPPLKAEYLLLPPSELLQSNIFPCELSKPLTEFRKHIPAFSFTFLLDFPPLNRPYCSFSTVLSVLQLIPFSFFHRETETALDPFAVLFLPLVKSLIFYHISCLFHLFRVSLTGDCRCVVKTLSTGF